MTNQVKDNGLIFNLEKIKHQAMTTAAQGAVTNDYPLDLETACKMLNGALATEIQCALRYKQHAIQVKGINSLHIAKEFREHAISEDEHAWALAVRIDQLGGIPDFNPVTIKSRATTDYGHAAELTDMIKENLIGERVAIDVYKQMIDWFGPADSTTRRLLEKILADEEEHANELANLLVGRAQEMLN